MKNAVRCFVAPWYLLGWASHVYLAITNPQIYRDFGNTARLPLFRDLWQALIMPNIILFALGLAVFELVTGLLIIGKGNQVKTGLVCSILFNLFLVQLGLSGHAADWILDFLMNRLPNLIFVAIQLPLLFSTFEQSLIDVVTSFFGDLSMHKISILLMTISLILTLLMGILPVHAGPASVSGGDVEALDAYITGQMSKHGIQGLSLAVTSGTEILYLTGYGTAGQGRPMTPQTPMYIGSQSKSVTGLAVAQLIEQGRISPNDPVRIYIPWFRVADEDASQRITVNHLLHHTSGLSEAGFTAILPEDASKEDAVRALASARLTAPVGEKHQYFNVGYDVLAVVIQNVTGMTFEQYIQENIFDPLEMTHTYTDPALARADGLSQGHSRFFGFTLPQRQPHRVFEVSAGFIISTAEDMAHYVIAMDNGGIYKGNRVLSPEGMNMLFTPVQGYGMGWHVEPGHISHGGANETFKTFVDIYPLRDMSIVLLINQGYMLDHFISAQQIFNGVEAIVLGRVVPHVSEGWSVKHIGWLLLLFVIVLGAYQTYNLLSLRRWTERARSWSAARKALDVGISFLIPTLILFVVFSQVKAFMGYRLNFTYQMITMFRTLPDIAILMIMGSVPDYVQGLVKLYWIVRGRTRTVYLMPALEDKKWIQA